MTLVPPFHYVRLGDFTYNLLRDPHEIKSHLMKWIMQEWESDYSKDPNEHWSFEWMQVLPRMEFELVSLPLADIRPHPNLWGLEHFQVELKERADDREESLLRGMSIEPLLLNHNGLQLMDGYTRYVVLKRYEQDEVFAYVGHV